MCFLVAVKTNSMCFFFIVWLNNNKKGCYWYLEQQEFNKQILLSPPQKSVQFDDPSTVCGRQLVMLSHQWSIPTQSLNSQLTLQNHGMWSKHDADIEKLRPAVWAMKKQIFMKFYQSLFHYFFWWKALTYLTYFQDVIDIFYVKGEEKLI